MKTIRAGEKCICRVEGRSMDPTLLPEDMLVAECCDRPSLHHGDLVVMRNSLPASQAGVEAPIVHRLFGKRLAHEKDGFILRTRGGATFFCAMRQHGLKTNVPEKKPVCCGALRQGTSLF